MKDQAPTAEEWRQSNDAADALVAERRESFQRFAAASDNARVSLDTFARAMQRANESLQRFNETQRAAADLAYHNLKTSGQLRRDEDQRALMYQINEGPQ